MTSPQAHAKLKVPSDTAMSGQSIQDEDGTLRLGIALAAQAVPTQLCSAIPGAPESDTCLFLLLLLLLLLLLIAIGYLPNPSSHDRAEPQVGMLIESIEYHPRLSGIVSTALHESVNAGCSTYIVSP